MIDDVVIVVNGTATRAIKSLTVDHNIYDAAGKFTAELGKDAAVSAVEGARVTIKISGVTVFDGIHELPSKARSKAVKSSLLGGRDMMGVVVDSCIEEFKTLRGKKLIDVAQKYLGGIDAVKGRDIQFIDGAGVLDIPQEYVQPTPGQTVFELLSGIAAARGIHFYMRPDGTIVFGKPQGFGSSTFSVWYTGTENNTISMQFNGDITKRYSRVTVYAQKESTSSLSPTQLNKKARVNDDQFTYFSKPLVIDSQLAGVSPEKQARMIIEQQRLNGWQLEYTLPGFSQRGRVWQPDTLCSVEDIDIPYRGMCLVYGRRFTLSKDTATTTITLSKVGVK